MAHGVVEHLGSQDRRERMGLEGLRGVKAVVEPPSLRLHVCACRKNSCRVPKLVEKSVALILEEEKDRRAREIKVQAHLQSTESETIARQETTTQESVVK